MGSIEPLCPGVFLQRHPLSMVGCRIGRMVTILKLSGDKLLIHSTADFSPEQIGEIRELGEPSHLFEATNFHDTYASQGRAAFSDLPFFAPDGFKDGAAPIPSLQDELRGEVDFIEIGGMPKLREHAVFHRGSKTLILADLMFNLPPSIDWWTSSFLRLMSGMKEFPAMSRLLKFYVKDADAYDASIDQIADLDFERIIVAHGEPIETDAKDRFLATVRRR